MPKLATALAVGTSVLVATGAAAAAERPGSLDTRIAYVLGEKIHALAVAPNDRILVAGGVQAYPGVQSTIRAFLREGSLDGAFGQEGKVEFAPDRGEIVALHVQPDGRIVLGITGSPPRLHRLNADGSPDPTFGASGVVDVQFPSANDWLMDVLVAADGSIVVVGAQLPEITPAKPIHLKRYLADGAPDLAFGTAGDVELSGEPYVFDVSLSGQGQRVVLFARAYGDRPLEIARLTEDGRLDPDFGRGNLAAVEFGDPRRARRAAPSQRSDWRPLTLPDGRIRIPLTFDVPRERPYRMALAGLTADGHPARRFGRRGLAVGPRPELPGGESPEHVIADPRGGLLVAGSLSSGADFTGDEAGLTRRFRGDGTPDRSFGRLGAARGAVPGGGYSVIEQRLALLDGDTLVAAEHNYDGKYGWWGPAAVRTLNANYDLDDPSISIGRGCRSIDVTVSDVSRLDEAVVRARGVVIRRTSRKHFRARIPDGVRRVSVRATDLAGNSSTRRARLPRC